MIADNFISSMVKRLGNRTDLQDDLLDVMNEVKESTLEKQAWFPWFLEWDTAQDPAHLTTVPGSEIVVLPDRYLAQIEDSDVYLLNGTEETVLKKMFYADMVLSIGSTDAPRAYALRGHTMRVRGIPTVAQDIRMQYYRSDDPFTGRYENNWLKYASAVLYGEVGMVCADKLVKDYEMAARFQQDAVKAWAELARENTARYEAAVNRVKGE